LGELCTDKPLYIETISAQWTYSFINTAEFPTSIRVVGGACGPPPGGY